MTRLVQQVSAERRRALGMHYTPDPVADIVVRLAVDDWASAPGAAEPLHVLDPACGDGALLAAAARAWPGTVRAWGGDVDPVALAGLRARLDPVANASLVGAMCGDGLLREPGSWEGLPDEGADLVVANPPFLGQLKADTTRAASHRRALRERYGPAANGYADAAALFVLAALDCVRPGGRVAVILPVSFLAARDSEAVRAAVGERARLVGLWVPGAQLFSAAVHVVVIVLERLAAHEVPSVGVPVARWCGRDAAPAPCAAAPEAASWGPLATGLGEVPGTPPRSVAAPDASGTLRTLGDVARITAGFRDQFYGVVSHVRDLAEIPDAPSSQELLEQRHDRWAPLVTSGAIDPARCRWGERPVRFAGRRWDAPVVDLATLERDSPSLARWAADVRRPKLVVASQTRVLEAAPDPTGGWWPSVPTVAVVPHDPADLWWILARLCSPSVSAHLAVSRAGTGLGPGTVRVSAASLRSLDLPDDLDDLLGAAQVLRSGHGGAPDVVHTALVEAARVGEPEPAAEVFTWWSGALGVGRPTSPAE